MHRFSLQISTNVIPATRDSDVVRELEDRGWAVSQEMFHRTVGHVQVFTVLVRVSTYLSQDVKVPYAGILQLTEVK